MNSPRTSVNQTDRSGNPLVSIFAFEEHESSLQAMVHGSWDHGTRLQSKVFWATNSAGFHVGLRRESISWVDFDRIGERKLWVVSEQEIEVERFDRRLAHSIEVRVGFPQGIDDRSQFRFDLAVVAVPDGLADPYPDAPAKAIGDSFFWRVADCFDEDL